MVASDRDRWNAKYTRGEHAADEPSRTLTELIDFLPAQGKAIDVAGGAGRHAIWLAEHGLDVTLADVSDVALGIARNRAAVRKLHLETLATDLEEEAFPSGPWDLILTFHFLLRPLFEVFPHALSPEGRLICVHPTRTNLQRHSKPSERFLLQDGELPALVRDLTTLHYAETWSGEGRHEAVLVAQAAGK